MLKIIIRRIHNMNGFDQTSSALSLAKQLIMECEGKKEITLSTDTLKIVLMAFTQSWSNEQERKRSEFKKAAV